MHMSSAWTSDLREKETEKEGLEGGGKERGKEGERQKVATKRKKKNSSLSFAKKKKISYTTQRGEHREKNFIGSPKLPRSNVNKPMYIQCGEGSTSRQMES